MHAYLQTWLEIARVALQDAEFFDYMAEISEISDSEMQNIRNTLEEFLQNGKVNHDSI